MYSQQQYGSGGAPLGIEAFDTSVAGDREYILSYLGTPAGDRISPYDAWTSALPSYINPLADATLNGVPFADVQQIHSSLPSRMKAIEDDIYGSTFYPVTSAAPLPGTNPADNNSAPVSSGGYVHKRKRKEDEGNSKASSTAPDSQQPKQKRHHAESPTNSNSSDGGLEVAGDSDEVDGDPANRAGDSYKAVRSRESSRRYRQRKKECFDKMRVQVELFEEEKRQWAKERDAASKLIERLTQENERLKEKTQSEALKVREERLALLTQMEDKIRAGAPDEDFVPLIAEVKARCTGIKELSQNLLRQFISPDAATYLASIGFFKDESLEVDKPSKAQSIYAFASKLQAELPDLSQEQQVRLHGRVENFYSELQRLVEERRLLAADLEVLYSHGPGDHGSDVPSVLNKLSSVQHLRENLIAESDLSLATISGMLDELTPTQAARFLVKAHFVHTGVMQLQMLWDALKHTPDRLPPVPQVLLDKLGA